MSMCGAYPESGLICQVADVLPGRRCSEGQEEGPPPSKC